MIMMILMIMLLSVMSRFWMIGSNDDTNDNHSYNGNIVPMVMMMISIGLMITK